MPGPYEDLLRPLNFPPYPFRLEEREGKLYIFDEIRRKMLLCTPEEWVRQHLLQFLVKHRQYPGGLARIEGGLKLNERQRRCDLLFFNTQGEKELLAECKAPSVRISQAVLDQLTAYNSFHRAKYLLVTNGLEHFCFEVDYDKASSKLLPEIPFFSS